MIAVMIAALLAAEPSPAAPPSPAPAAQSLQARFDRANEAYEASRFDDAIQRYEALERDAKVQKVPLVLSTVLMRKGASLTELGRLEQAEDALLRGLKIAPADRAEIRSDRYLAEHSLGLIDLDRLDYRAAAGHFKAALTLADESASKAQALVFLSRATAFEPGDAAVRYADQALAEIGVPAAKDEKAKKMTADVRTIRARALLNEGRSGEALDVLELAVKEQGGLDLSVNAAEIVTRSDLAIAAMLSKLPKTARRYLAYTGAGRIDEAPFQRAMSMDLPSCGGPAGLRPEDVAIVEFGIDTDGSVRGVRPIYASVKGKAAFDFARAVSSWSWRAEDVAKIPLLFRAMTRVELRCSTGAERSPTQSLLTAKVAEWLATLQLPNPPSGANDGATLALLRSELTRRDAAGGGPGSIALLLDMAGNPVATTQERVMWLTDARERAGKVSAPPAALVAIEVLLADAARNIWSRSSAETYRADLRRILGRPGADDPVASGILNLMIAERIYKLPPPPDAMSLVKAVAEDERLPAQHQLRVGAFVRLAALQAAAGDMPGAAESFRRTGLEARQCALLDSPPAMIRHGASSADYPMEALLMGFEGWVRTEYDITADGKTAAQRAIVAYPPLVFRDAGVGIARDTVYAKSYRPDGSAGCTAATQNINFRIPKR